MPFEVGLDVMPADLVLKVLDRQVGGPHHHVCARNDDDDVDAVCGQPAANGPGIPSRVADPDAREDERDAGERRQAVREQRQRARQLFRARVHGRAVVGADDVEGVEEAVDERPRDADRDGRQHEGQHDRADGREVDVHHQSRWIFK